VKLRCANGTTFVTIPKKIATQISSEVIHLSVVLEGDKIVFRPMEGSA